MFFHGAAEVSGLGLRWRRSTPHSRRCGEDLEAVGSEFDCLEHGRDGFRGTRGVDSYFQWTSFRARGVFAGRQDGCGSRSSVSPDALAPCDRARHHGIGRLEADECCRQEQRTPLHDVTLAILGDQGGFRMSLPCDAPGLQFALAQPTSLVCWATVFTMMYSWRRQSPIAIRDAVNAVSDEVRRHVRPKPSHATG